MIDWVECELSGNLKADGKKGQYWIMAEAWTYVELVNPTPAGPKVKRIREALGEDFTSVEDAKHFVNTYDTQEEEE